MILFYLVIYLTFFFFICLTPPPPRGRPAGPGAGGCVSGRASALDDGEDVAGGEDQVVLARVLDLGAAVLGVEHHVADGDVERDPLLALVVEAAGADRDDGALLRLLLGGVRDDKAGRGGRLRLVGLDHDAVLERLDVDLGGGRHELTPPPEAGVRMWVQGRNGRPTRRRRVQSAAQQIEEKVHKEREQKRE